MADEGDGVVRVTVPGAVLAVAREQLDPVHVGAKVEAAAPEDLPHAVRSAAVPLPRVLWQRVGAERDGGAMHDARESCAPHRAAAHGQVGGRPVPAGAANLQPARRGHGPQQLVPVRVVTRAHE